MKLYHQLHPSLEMHLYFSKYNSAYFKEHPKSLFTKRKKVDAKYLKTCTKVVLFIPFSRNMMFNKTSFKITYRKNEIMSQAVAPRWRTNTWRASCCFYNNCCTWSSTFCFPFFLLNQLQTQTYLQVYD